MDLGCILQEEPSEFAAGLLGVINGESRIMQFSARAVSLNMIFFFFNKSSQHPTLRMGKPRHDLSLSEFSGIQALCGMMLVTPRCHLSLKHSVLRVGE